MQSVLSLLLPAVVRATAEGTAVAGGDAEARRVEISKQ